MDGTIKKCRECLEELGISESECLEGFAKGKWRLNPVNDLKHIYGMSKKARGNMLSGFQIISMSKNSEYVN